MLSPMEATKDSNKSGSEYTHSEELAHAWTHGIGAALSIAGLVLLVVRAAQTGDVWRVVSFAIFGTSAVLLYGASTIYHASVNSPSRQKLKVVDHSMIYVLIAGSYTPFLLVSLRGPWGWSLFGVIWGLTIAGIAFKVFFAGRFNVISTLLYLGLGWMCVIAAKPMLDNVPSGALWWLLFGGLSYSLGTIFYLRKSMRYHHAVWHLFVLAGTACHFVAVYGYLSGDPA
jgi:hemolysin III